MHPDISSKRYLTAGQVGRQGDIVVGFYRDRDTVPVCDSAQLSGGQNEPSKGKVSYLQNALFV